MRHHDTLKLIRIGLQNHREHLDTTGFMALRTITAFRPGYAGCGVGRLMLVEVAEGPNGVTGHSGGTPVLLKKWDGKTGGSQGVWSAATVPKPKTTIEKVVYD